MIVTRMDRYLKKAGEYIGRNVVIVTIKYENIGLNVNKVGFPESYPKFITTEPL